MANVLLSVIMQKYTIIFILSLFGAGQLFYAIRECFSKRKKENLYLLSARLISAARSAESFDDLDKVKADYFTKFRLHIGHNDFKDCDNEIWKAIFERTEHIHEQNFN